MRRKQQEVSDNLILLGVLDAISNNGVQSQRHLASELGIALGLVNVYLKRCVKKGLIKVSEVPARRYAYYLTPKGFVEKSRLAATYFTDSFSFFRKARADCAAMLSEFAAARPGQCVVLAGKSDLAEVAILCAIDAGVRVVAIVDPDGAPSKIAQVPVVASYEAVGEEFSAVIVTHLLKAAGVYADACERFTSKRVFAPSFLGLSGEKIVRVL